MNCTIVIMRTLALVKDKQNSGPFKAYGWFESVSEQGLFFKEG